LSPQDVADDAQGHLPFEVLVVPDPATLSDEQSAHLDQCDECRLDREAAEIYGDARHPCQLPLPLRQTIAVRR
jgi:hypothetical protein